MLKIRLTRYGRKKLPFYRIVLIDARKKREGMYIAQLGSYDPFSKKVSLDKDLYNKYVFQGAQPTDIVKNLYERLYGENSNE